MLLATSAEKTVLLAAWSLESSEQLSSSRNAAHGRRRGGESPTQAAIEARSDAHGMPEKLHYQKGACRHSCLLQTGASHHLQSKAHQM